MLRERSARKTLSCLMRLRAEFSSLSFRRTPSLNLFELIAMNLKNLRMKHYAMMLAALVAGVLLFTECASMRIPYRRLPARAKAFIETYFPTESCVYAERDRDDGRREYEVKLSNGTNIDFHASGDWKKVDCEYSFLPAGIVPQAIVDDLAERFPGARISKAERERGGYKLTLGSGAEMIYAADGRFIRVEYD